MAEYEILCTHCLNNLSFQDEMLGEEIACPECNSKLELTCPPAVLATGNDEFSTQDASGEQTLHEELSVEEPPHEEAAVEEHAAQIIALEEPANVQLPQRMKANRIVAGRICPACNAAIALGEDVFNCQKCASSMHGSCFDKQGHCANVECEDGQLVLQKKSKLHIKNAIPSENEPADDSVPCRFCGEKIRKDALKCRFCNEFQNDADRKRQEKVNNYSDDDSLTGVDIALCILCSGIACILGIVYVCQGKKKGWKMIGISLLVQMIFGAIQLMMSKS
jgi:DNA-directed RNA polymerase subunit RPC12/RpoP